MHVHNEAKANLKSLNERNESTGRPAWETSIISRGLESLSKNPLSSDGMLSIQWGAIKADCEMGPFNGMIATKEGGGGKNALSRYVLQTDSRQGGRRGGKKKLLEGELNLYAVHVMRQVILS